MTYNYILKWSKGEKERIRVEAWPRSRALATPHENGRPSFIIGEVCGSRAIMLWSMLESMRTRYKLVRKGTRLRIDFPDKTEAIADAYRVGLACMAVSRSESSDLAQQSLAYVMRAPKEEVWFWASKFLGVVDSAHEVESVIEALCLISGAMEPGSRIPKIRESRVSR